MLYIKAVSNADKVETHKTGIRNP